MIYRVGIDLPTIEVRFEHLKIDAEAYVGSRALPSFLNFCINIVEVISNSFLSLFVHKKDHHFSFHLTSFPSVSEDLGKRI